LDNRISLYFWRGEGGGAAKLVLVRAGMGNEEKKAKFNEHLIVKCKINVNNGGEIIYYLFFVGGREIKLLFEKNWEIF
jgi:hypothetical protein